MRKRFIITLDIDNLSFELYGKNYNEIKDLLEVVYDGVCLDKTAMKKFSDVVKKQTKEYHTPNNTKPGEWLGFLMNWVIKLLKSLDVELLYL